jgi:hypothetical protein
VNDDDGPSADESGEYLGDSPGPPMEIPDAPVAVDKPGTTAEEHREPSLERRLAMEEPDVSEAWSPGGSPPVPKPILDDDVPTEDLVMEDPDAVAEEADLDREPKEVGEESTDLPQSAEESAMHLEDE